MSDLNQAIKETEEILLSKGRIHASLHLTKKYKLSLAEASKITEELSEKLRKEGKHIAQLPASSVKFPFVIFGSVFLLIGLPMLIGALYVFQNNEEVYANRLAVEGEVIALEGDDTYVPVVAYEYQGNMYEIRGEIASSPPSFKVGEMVDVLVNPVNPADGKIDSFMERWFLILILGGMGLVFSSIGLGAIMSKPLGKLLSAKQNL